MKNIEIFDIIEDRNEALISSIKYNDVIEIEVDRSLKTEYNRNMDRSTFAPPESMFCTSERLSIQSIKIYNVDNNKYYGLTNYGDPTKNIVDVLNKLVEKCNELGELAPNVRINLKEQDMTMILYGKLTSDKCRFFVNIQKVITDSHDIDNVLMENCKDKNLPILYWNGEEIYRRI